MTQPQYKLDFNERADSTPAWLARFEQSTQALWRYPDRRALEQRMASDLDLPDGALMLTNGGDESIELLFKNCKLSGESMLVPEPCFSQYSHNQTIWDNRCVFVSALPDLGIDVAALKSQIQPNQWVILTRPNNPTAEYIEQNTLIDLIQTAKAKGAWVFLDEAYVEFALEAEPIDYAAFDNLITLRTFSKAFGLAGARIGYIFGAPDLLNKFRRLAMPFNVSNPNLQLAEAAWAARDEVTAYCQTIANNREQVVKLLQDNGLNPFPSRGNFVLFETNPLQKQLLGRHLAKRGIQIKTALVDLPNAVRITIPENVDPLLGALQNALSPELLAFDMDGVLIDTVDSYDACIKQTVKALTGSNINQDNIEQVRALGGFNNDWDLSAELIRRQGQEASQQTVIDTFQKLYLGNTDQPGLRDRETNLLQRNTKNLAFDSGRWHTAVVTGRPRAEAEYGVEQLGITPQFLVSADDVSQQKPNPEGLLWTKTQTQSQRAWFCGDTVDDMQAGTAADCVCIGIGATTPGAIENLYNAGADVVLESVNQLEALL